MKVVIDWFYDFDVQIHSIYVNEKKFRYGNFVDLQPGTLLLIIKEFATVAGIEIELNKHNWDSLLNPDPMDLLSEVEVDISGW